MTVSLLRVLMYHRVVEPGSAGGGNPSVISASPDAFDRQMRHLARHYRVVSADDVVRAFRHERSLPPRSVLLTFDDGYRDFGEVAWPILRRYGLPATLFVPTAYPDHSEREFWWDRLARALATTTRQTLTGPCGHLRLHTREARLSSLRRLRRCLKGLEHANAMRWVEALCEELGSRTPVAGMVHTWDELRALAVDGVTVAPHTRTHAALTRLSPDEVRAEIRGSRDDIQRELGTVPPVFSYPFGEYDNRVVSIAREEGMELAVTCQDGYTDVPSGDPLRLRRTNVTLRTTPFVFRARLTRYGAYLDGWRLAAKAWRGRRTHPHGSELEASE